MQEQCNRSFSQGHNIPDSRARVASWGALLVCLSLSLGLSLFSGGCQAPAESRCSADVCEVTINRSCQANEDCCCSQRCTAGICTAQSGGESSQTEASTDAATNDKGTPDTTPQDKGGPDKGTPDVPGPQDTPRDQSVAEVPGDTSTPPDATKPETNPETNLETNPGNCRNGEKRSCYQGPRGTRGVGECKDGTQTCAGGKWGFCEGDVFPKDEKCDGKDNNCNGKVDDIKVTECDTGLKADCRRGDRRCTGGKIECVPRTKPSTEVCDGKDNDCDGQTDEAGCKELCEACTQDSECKGQGSRCLAGNKDSSKACFSKCNRSSDCASGFRCGWHPSTGIVRYCLPSTSSASSRVSSWYWWCDNYKALSKKCSKDSECGAGGGGLGGRCEDSQCSVSCGRSNSHCPRKGWADCDKGKCKEE